MGSYNGAEVCELVRIFILILGGKKVGLSRDDRLGVLRTPGQTANRLQKNIINVFQPLGLKITIAIDINQKAVNYLDETINLSSSYIEEFLLFYLTFAICSERNEYLTLLWPVFKGKSCFVASSTTTDQTIVCLVILCPS